MKHRKDFQLCPANELHLPLLWHEVLLILRAVPAGVPNSLYSHTRATVLQKCHVRSTHNKFLLWATDCAKLFWNKNKIWKVYETMPWGMNWRIRWSLLLVIKSRKLPLGKILISTVLGLVFCTVLTCWKLFGANLFFLMFIYGTWTRKRHICTSSPLEPVVDLFSVSPLFF